MLYQATSTQNVIELCCTCLLMLHFGYVCDEVGRFLRTRLRSRRALAIEQRKSLGIENPVILLETDTTEAMSQQESPRSLLNGMEMDASPRHGSPLEDASPASPDQTESNMEYEFETS